MSLILENAVRDARVLYQDMVCAVFLHETPCVDGHAVVMPKPSTDAQLHARHLAHVVAYTGKALMVVLPNAKKIAVIELNGCYELYPLSQVRGLVYFLPPHSDIAIIPIEKRKEIAGKLEQYINETNGQI